MCIPPIAKSVAKQQQSKLEISQKRLVGLLKDRKQLPVLRAFFGWSKNYGHIGTGFAVVQTLLRLSDSTILDVEIIADAYDGIDKNPVEIEKEKVDFVKRANRFLPGLPDYKKLKAQNFVYIWEGVSYHFFFMDSSKDPPTIEPKLNAETLPAVFAGGVDDTHDFFIDGSFDALNTLSMLVVQPFAFYKYSADNVIYFNKDVKVKGAPVKPILLSPQYDRDGINREGDGGEGVFKAEFNQLAYYFDLNTLKTQENWQFFEKSKADESTVVNQILKLNSAKEANFCPVYFSETRALVSAQEVLFDLVLSIRYAKLKNIGLRRATVVALQANYTDAVYEALTEIFKNESMKEFFTVSGILPWYADQFEVLDLDAAAADDGKGLMDACAKVKAEGVVLLKLGSLPSFASNYFQSQASFGTVFEGEGSANFLFNLDIPLIHLVAEDLAGKPEGISSNTIYPSFPIGSVDPVAKACHQASLSFVASLEDSPGFTGWLAQIQGWTAAAGVAKEDLRAKMPDATGGQWLSDSFTEGNKFEKYFASNGDYYQKNPENSKFYKAAFYYIDQLTSLKVIPDYSDPSNNKEETGK